MQEKNVVGIDCGKKSLEIIRIKENDNLERFQTKTDVIGRKKLHHWLKKDDVVGLEAGNISFLLAKEIKKEVGCEVIVLNPGDLAMIYQSLKKTDKEDCLKIARLIKRNPRKELPEVRIPDEYEEYARQLLGEQEYWTASKTRAINRLHSLFHNCGITMVTKKEIRNTELRLKIINGLNDQIKRIASRLESEIILAESMLEKILIEIQEALAVKKEEVEIIMSVSGIGIITCLSILGFIGDGRRFSHSKQVSYYAGLVPRVDISGDTEKRCGIGKRGCHQLRRVMTQCAWAMVRSKYAKEFKEKFDELKKRKGKGIAIIAVARKMIELVHHLLVNGEKYRYMPDDVLKKKLAQYKIS